MPIELDTHEPSEPMDVQPGTNEADALCFLYANSDYGFKPAEVREHTDIPNNSAYKALSRLYEKDLLGKTADGFYHALDDPMVARYAASLTKGATFDMDTGHDEYPDNIEATTTGFPADDQPEPIGTTEPEDVKGPYPEDL